ncbi:sensor histidine kinase [Lacibacter luteus]|nr:sensor histidine kinase [Lacibacter luteus]
MKEEFEKQFLKSQFEVQEQTFQQIGKELHDNVGQLLSTSRMLIGLTERELQNPPDTLLTANATLGQAINEIRSLAKSLDKEWLERFSFSENIQTMIERINAAKDIVVEYIQSVELPLRSDEQIILFRIVQEAIQNAVKHAGPTNMRIAVEANENIYLITVSDNGRGFDVGSVSKSMGLANMEHRVQLLQGTIHFNSIAEGGTTVAIRLPLKTEEP